MNYGDSAEYLGVSVRTLRNLVAANAIAHIRIGSLVRFRTADLDAYLDAHRVEAQ